MDHVQGSFGSALSPVPPPHPHPPLAPLFVAAAIVVVVWVLISLAIASISKAIAYIYSNDEEDPAIVKSIFKSLPKSLYRIFITVLCLYLIGDGLRDALDPRLRGSIGGGEKN